VIDKDLLEILACPETHQPLREADEALVAKVNARIAAGLDNVGGKRVEGEIDGGLVREDGAVLYPIRDDIPVLLIDEGIRLEGLDG
jgi:uncharacterized protein YbaR (Trm112 family)